MVGALRRPARDRALPEHVVDKFGLRDYMQFAPGWSRWSSTKGQPLDADTSDGATTRPGSWSPPRACCPRRSSPRSPVGTLQGRGYHTGLWPKEGVDLKGKRVAMIGTGASAVQLLPAIAAEVARSPSTSGRRTGARPAEQLPDHAGGAGGDQGQPGRDLALVPLDVRRLLPPRRHEDHVRGHQEQRREFYEKLWKPRGFAKLFSNYNDLMVDPGPTPSSATSWPRRSASGSTTPPRPRCSSPRTTASA